MVYFSIATVAAELAGLGVLWIKGGFNNERLFQLMAAANDVDLYTMWKKMEAASQPIKKAQVSFREVIDGRDGVALNLDVRELAVDKGLIDMRMLETTLGQERKRYQLLRAEFERQLEQLRQGAVDQAVLDVQRQLESVSAKMAKDQLVRILDDDAIEPDVALHFFVTIVKAMPLDKRKRIFAEFKNQDSERLHAILRQIRLGVPDVQLIRETRNQLEEFISRK
jgi:hypothetical protein